MARRKPADDEDDAPKTKRKPARKAVDEDDDDDAPTSKRKPVRAAVVEDDDDDVEDYSKPKKAGENAYTGLLAIAFLCLAGAAVLLFLDTSELNEKPLPQPTLTLPALGTAAPAAPGVPAGPGL